jgi:hypothetical protein
MKRRSSGLDELHDELGYVLTGPTEPLARVLRWCAWTAYRLHHRVLLAAPRATYRRLG